MWVVLKYSDVGKPISHVMALGPFDNEGAAVRHARDMRLLASERWFYSICELIVPAVRATVA